MSNSRIHWIRILLGSLFAEVALIIAIVPLGLHLGGNFLLYGAPPRIIPHTLLGSVVGRPSDRISFHPSRHFGRSRRRPDLPPPDALAARTLRLHRRPRTETRRRSLRRCYTPGRA